MPRCDCSPCRRDRNVSIAAPTCALAAAQPRARAHMPTCPLPACTLCPGADYHARLSAGISSSLARLRDLDADAREALRSELALSAELLDHAARGAMAALLQVLRARRARGLAPEHH